MRNDSMLSPEHVGKYMMCRATNHKSIAVKIISVGNDLVGWSMLDPAIPMRSAKVRFDPKRIFSIYDTEEEVNYALNKLKNSEESEEKE